VTLTVVPWLTHNYLKIGQFTFDAPFQYKIIASQYAYSGNLDIWNYDFENKSLGRVLIDFTLKDPGFVFGFIANHFLSGEINGLLALPLVEKYNGILAPINLYWMSWDGSLAWYNVLLLIFYLAVIAFGLGAAWRRWRWVGLLPLAFNVGYALATAIGRFSGWRYDLPVDWVPYFYFGIGFAECIEMGASLFGAKLEAVPSHHAEAQSSEETPPLPLRLRDFALSPGFIRPLLLPVFLFILIGALPWLAEFPAKPRYADQSPQILEAHLFSIPATPALGEVQSFLAQPGAVLAEGRLLYPRFFYRGTGMPSANAWPAYAVRGFPRTGFLLLNNSLTDALFPAKDVLPIPHGGEAILLGCQREGYLEVRLIAFPDSEAIYISQPLSDPCTPG
jgi:hypothetical protein